MVDKNKLLGVLLLSVMLILYSHFFNSPSTVPATEKLSPPAAAETASMAAISHTSPLFYNFTQGTEQETILENDVLRIVLSSYGAKVKKVILKEYLDHQGQPLALLDKQSSSMGLQFTIQQRLVQTHQLFFKTIQETTPDSLATTEQVAGRATFMLSLAPNQYIRHTFTLPQKGYELVKSWELVGFEQIIDQNKVDFFWQDHIKRTEQDIEACRNKTTINYYLADNHFKNLKEQSNKAEEAIIQQPVQWIAIKQRFFTAAIVAQEKPFLTGHCLLKPSSHPQEAIKETQVKLSLPIAGGIQSGSFKFYFGPNTYQDLKHVATGFSKNLPLGWPVVRGINEYFIIPVFDWLTKHVTNYGVAILLLVTLIKLLLLPLSYKSYLAMAEMKIIKPALEILREKHGKDAQQMQLEQVKLYREMGINPLSGCIPVLLQMPILLAMFNFFPNAIELRQQSFLWAPDLSTYDAFISLPFSIPFYGSHISLFTLLMTASTLLYTWSSNQMNMPEGPMKAMSYLFPLTFMFILNSFPAGLSLYYLISNLITFGQQALIKKFVDEEKLKEKLEKNKVKIQNKGLSFKQQLQNTMKTTSHKKISSSKI
jgi:YidC/Oxa1 family membrane protein insertase